MHVFSQWCSKNVCHNMFKTFHVDVLNIFFTHIWNIKYAIFVYTIFWVLYIGTT